MKFLDRESLSGLLDLSSKIFEELREKHQPATEIEGESLLYGPFKQIPPNVYDIIDEQIIFHATGPSGMDAELCHIITCSKNFKTEGKALREEIATILDKIVGTLSN